MRNAELASNHSSLSAEVEELGKRVDATRRATGIARDERSLRIGETEGEVDGAKKEMEETAIVLELKRVEAEAREEQQRGNEGWFSFLGWFRGAEGDLFDEGLVRARSVSESTLVAALENERQAVLELEDHAFGLRQNNTAISEMLLSRDDLIDQLNSRVSVFEEDEEVLKEALKRLRSEMAVEIRGREGTKDELAEKDCGEILLFFCRSSPPVF